MEIGSWAEIIGAFCTIITIIISARQFYKQNRLNFYEQYTERNMQIMKEMPTYILYKNDNDKIEDDNKEYFRKNVFLYFDLCSEEYYLSQTGNLDEQVWNDWKDGMKDFFERRLVNEQLQEIVIIYNDAYSDFIDFLKYELLIKNI